MSPKDRLDAQRHNEDPRKRLSEIISRIISSKTITWRDDRTSNNVALNIVDYCPPKMGETFTDWKTRARGQLREDIKLIHPDRAGSESDINYAQLLTSSLDLFRKPDQFFARLFLNLFNEYQRLLNRNTASRIPSWHDETIRPTRPSTRPQHRESPPHREHSRQSDRDLARLNNLVQEIKNAFTSNTTVGFSQHSRESLLYRFAEQFYQTSNPDKAKIFAEINRIISKYVSERSQTIKEQLDKELTAYQKNLARSQEGQPRNFNNWYSCFNKILQLAIEIGGYPSLFKDDQSQINNDLLRSFADFSDRFINLVTENANILGIDNSENSYDPYRLVMEFDRFIADIVRLAPTLPRDFYKSEFGQQFGAIVQQKKEEMWRLVSANFGTTATFEEVDFSRYQRQLNRDLAGDKNILNKPINNWGEFDTAVEIVHTLYYQWLQISDNSFMGYNRRKDELIHKLRDNIHGFISAETMNLQSSSDATNLFNELNEIPPLVLFPFNPDAALEKKKLLDRVKGYIPNLLVKDLKVGAGERAKRFFQRNLFVQDKISIDEQQLITLRYYLEKGWINQQQARRICEELNIPYLDSYN